ncbi:TCP-1/cpn60 chaperonin family protein [Streptomyces sp. NPDC053048]|uniref:caspase family protein n=1 Tax=Streptomyces sp. NPDC053048 TaxID=3365694 RepID=UPI0037CE1D14
MTDLADPLQSKAVLIGVSAYEKLTPLPTVVNNLTDLAAALHDPEKWGLTRERCIVLPERRAPADVSTVLHQVAQEPLDTLLVYFAGHGLVEKRTGELVLAMGRTSSEVPHLTGLRYPDVRDILRDCRADRLLLILDCCFSGRATGVMADPSSVVVGQLDIEGTYVLASTDATAPGRASDGGRHTAFTSGLLEVIGKGVPSGRPYLTPGDLFEYTRRIMAGHGWPQPTQSHENRIRELQLMRNPWSGALRWFSKRRHSGARPDTGASDLVVGIHVAVSAVRPALGPAGPDSLTELETAMRRADRRWLPGMELVRDVMTVMRRDYGDGAATAAIVVSELLSGIHEAVRAGTGWQEVADCADEEAAAVLRRLAAPVPQADGPTAEEMGGAVATALGDVAEAARVMAAVARVGAHRVEITTGPHAPADPESGLSFVSRLTLDTSVLVPNSSVRAVTLHEPYVLVAPGGDIPVAELQHIGWRQPGPLLIIAPRADSFAMSSLHRLFAETVVVVCPAGPATDWDALCARTGHGLLAGRPLGRAGRALVTPSSITVTGLPGTAPVDSGRVQVHAGPAGGAAHAAAVRALAVARSAGRSGVLPGGGSALYRAGRALGADAGLFHAALAAPLRQLARNAGQDADEVMALLDAAPAEASAGFEYGSGSVTDLRAAGVLDSVATVRGVVENALAAVSRYVTSL